MIALGFTYLCFDFINVIHSQRYVTDLPGFVVKTSYQEGLIINQSQQVGGLITHGHRITEGGVQVQRASRRFVLARASFGIGEGPYDFAEIELFHICSRGLNRVYVISIVNILSRKRSRNSPRVTNFVSDKI